VLLASACGSSSSTASTASTASTGSSATTVNTGGTAGGTARTASAPGVTATTITIGYLTSQTGGLASSYSGSEKGVEAAFAGQNAKGGIDGRQLKLISVDDQSTPTGNLTAAQSLVSKGVFGIIEPSSVDSGSGNYLHQQDIPVTGDVSEDAPWATYDNFFSQFGGVSLAGSGGLEYSGYQEFIKSLGITKWAVFGYGTIPSSVRSAKSIAASIVAAGLQVPYENLSLPLGTNDFTAEALAMKKAGVQGGVCLCAESSNIAMNTAARQAGINLSAIYVGGADGTVFSNAATTGAIQGGYFPTYITPPDLKTPATTAFVSNLENVDSSYKGGYPNFGTQIAYLGADMMIYGLQLAGPNPTRQAFISNMQKVSSYDAGGLLAGSVGWNHPGKEDATSCQYFTKVVGTAFVTVNNGKPFCGSILPMFQSHAVSG
jgi:branched-chain amino acid transport system substrate-binding protein